MNEFIVVDTEIGMIAGKIIDSDETSYTLSFNGTEVKALKEYVYEYEGNLYIQGHDVGE